MYASRAHAFTEQAEVDAGLFARQAAVALANASAYWQVSDRVVGLQQAMESRAVIEQAKGMIMASRHCTADEAFQALIDASQRGNVKLRELARRMVDGTQRIP